MTSAQRRASLRAAIQVAGVILAEVTLCTLPAPYPLYAVLNPQSDERKFLHR